MQLSCLGGPILYQDICFEVWALVLLAGFILFFASCASLLKMMSSAVDQHILLANEIRQAGFLSLIFIPQR